jgi:O-antigen/teichoic acid export membrane protein
MASLVRKSRERLSLISMSAVYNIFPVAFNMIMAALVVRLFNPNLWGEMVQIQLWTGIAGNVIAWGNKDFLLRSFSMSPATITTEWQKSFGSRSVICCVAAIVLIFFPVAVLLKCLLVAYLFARFIYLSYDSLIIYKRKFFITVILESLGFLVISAALIIFYPADLTQLFLWFVIAEAIKAFLVMLYFRKELLPVILKKIDPEYFTLAFSFFVLYFTGMLASKIDLVCITFFLSKADIARYQVLMNFFQTAQMSALILLLPFIKNIYRLKLAAVRKIATRLFIIGIFLSGIAVILIKEAVDLIYEFKYDPSVFLFGWLIVVPTFYYSPLIYRLFKTNKQNTVIMISLIFAVSSAALILTLIKLFNDPFISVFAAMAIVQCVQGTVYFFVSKPERNRDGV